MAATRRQSTMIKAAVTVIDDVPFGKRSFRVQIDPARDDSKIACAVADHIRAEFLRRIGLGNFLIPQVNYN